MNVSYIYNYLLFFYMANKNPEKIVMSVGGNALTLGPDKETVEDQNKAAGVAAKIVAAVFNSKVKLALTHGNGPQVGFILRRFEHALKAGILHPVPLDAIDADTQGAIGYMLERLIYNELINLDPALAVQIATLVTQILVDPNDPAFANPDKPIGSWLTQEEAIHHTSEDGWTIRELKPQNERGYRRVVPSPKPMGVVNVEAIKHNFSAGFLTICGGGGGVPVMRKSDGTLVGVEGVIDKDRTTALIARLIGARLMAVLTATAGVIAPDDFRKHGTDGPVIPVMTTGEARDILPYLQAGSMGPKVEACVAFTEATGEPSLITDFDHALSAITEGRGGTRIIYA